MNIRNESDLATIEAKGFTWVTVEPRGESKGKVFSKHRTYDAANKAAKNLDRKIVEVSQAQYF